ncbi:NAB6 (YML117W) [Zygosaccharomyces parabailii]|nr:NAB6 (YML117W) [Zygosaccharomyces parabailii]
MQRKGSGDGLFYQQYPGQLNASYRPRERDQETARVMANSPMAYPPVGSLQLQYGGPQQAYYAAAGPPLMNAPPTPFDTAYGITLLPSHLLIGSPYVSSPDLFQSHHQAQNQGSNMKHQSAVQRQRRPPRGSGGSRLSQAYPVAPPLKNPPALARNRHRRRAQHEQASKMFQEPFVVSYKMLPKGDDEYRTRSLLFENVNSSVDLYSFVSKYSKYGPVESIYMFRNRADKSKNSVLLSFLSRKICLDSYNSVLQRLAEFKTGLKSKSLTVSFVSLKYKRHVEPEEEDQIGEDNDPGDGDDAYNVSVVASLQYDIVNRGATRSLALNLDDECDKDELLKNRLDFLSPSKNQRYVLESIYLIKAKEATRHFPKNYAILTFLNISMAVEVLDYLRNSEQNFESSQCFFVSVSPHSQPSFESNTSFDHTGGAKNNSAGGLVGNAPNGNLGSYTSKNASLSSLNSFGSYISLDQEIDLLATSLQGSHTVIVAVDHYPQPFFAEYTDHLSNASVSEASALDTQMLMPRPQEMTVQSQDSPVGPSSNAVNSGTTSLSTQVLHSQMEIGSGMYMEPFGSRSNQGIVKPITQSLQKQFATSAEVANSMGGGIGNRTVYIGNIHPRSRAEDICNVVRGGILQSIRFLQDKHICFVTFIEASTAVEFYTNAFIDPIVLHGNMLKVGWGHHSGPLPKSISLAVTVGASRNVYVSLPDFAFKDKYINDPQYQKYNGKFKLPTEEILRKDFSQYGDTEQINFLSDGHCCWVNFMNISSAIKLVEEVKYNDGEAFYKTFDDRYRGLIIGYGKDRCGNVNKNLIAGKNSRFYKKVKKPSYNIRLSRMEEKRRKHEESLRLQNQSNSEKLLQFGSLGITLEGKDERRESKGSNSQSDDKESALVHELDHSQEQSSESGQQQVSGEKYDEEEKELLKLSNKSQILDGLGIAAAVAEEDKDRTVAKNEEILHRACESDDEESLDSGVSSNVELIIHSPLGSQSDLQKSDKPERTSKKYHGSSYASMTEGASAVSNPSLRMNPPMAPSTISRNYSLMMKSQNGHNSHNRQQNQGFSAEDHASSSQGGRSKGQRNRRRNKRRSAKTIPGSDVMAQYLAQLQHSTFMYAANILGATAEGDVNYYDDSAEN